MKRTRFGPYELLDPLGRGGMGVVYRARHRDSGELVALKTVHLLKEGQLQGIRREIDALARLSHPGIVRILEHGVEAGQPWYAMELLPGRSLRQLLVDGFRSRPPEATAPTETTPETEPWWTEALGDAHAGPQATLPRREPTAAIPPPLDAEALSMRLRLVQRLCQTLAFLHGEGLVHRDLKPENIIIAASSERRATNSGGSDSRSGSLSRPARESLLAASDWPVLVDFGLVSPFRGQVSRESLEVALGAHGTAAYIAPEQARGEAVDARADLYALGCILYEMLVGRPPFVGQNRYQVLWQHWEVEPPAPSALVQGVPPQLDELTLRLLAKEPRQRLGYASDVAAILERITPDVSTLPALSEGRPYVYRPGFHGRERQLWALERKLDELSVGATGGLVLLAGESGAGKTRLALELSRKAAQLGFEVLLGESGSEAGEVSAESERSARALRPLSGPLRRIADRCREMGEEETERLLGRRGPVLALYEPSLKGLPGQEHYGPAEELPAEAAKARLFRYLLQTFEALAATKPLLLVLDDLQWADELTMGFVGALNRSRRAKEITWLLLGTFRSEEQTETLEAMLTQPGVWKIELGRLDEEAVGTMVADMLALAEPPKLFGGYLTRHSEGNPYFVAEYVQAAVEENLLVRDRQGRWHVGQAGDERATEAAYEALELPRSLLALLERRLKGLSAAARLLVETASVLGRESDVAMLGRVSGRDAEELWPELRELERRGILLSTDRTDSLTPAAAGPAPTSVRFAHDKIREVAYAKIHGRRRRALHRVAAEALQTHGDPERDDQATLGRHWEQAGSRRKARDCYLIAARRSVRLHALEVAEELYRAYLRLSSRPTPERVEARIELVRDVLHVRGQLRGAEDEGQIALAEARSLEAFTVETQTVLALGNVAHDAGHRETARALYEQGLTLARRIGDLSAEATLLRRLASLFMSDGRLEEAQRHVEQALVAHRQLGDRRQEGIDLDKLGVLYWHRGLPQQAMSLLEQALAIHRELGNRREEGLALQDLASVTHFQGLVPEAIRLMEEVIAIRREIGNRGHEAEAVRSLGALYHDITRLKDARRCYEQALAIQRELGHRRVEGITLGSLGALCFEEGRCDEAREYFAQSLEILRDTGERRIEGRVLASLAELDLSEGELETAEKRFEQALALLREAGYGSMEAEALTGMGSVQLGLGRPIEAGRLYEQSLALQRDFPHELTKAITLRRWAALMRRTGDELARAEAAAEGSYTLVAKLGDRLEEGNTRCELGHLALASGKTASAQLDEVKRIADHCELEAKSPLCKAHACLERAQAAFEAGQSLFRGELLEDLPKGLQRWLTETGQLAADQHPGSG